MEFWDQVWATVLGGAVLTALVSVATVVVTTLRQRLGKRPDWRVWREPGGSLKFERARRRTAFEVRINIIGEGNILLQSSETMVQHYDLPARAVTGTEIRRDWDVAFVTIDWIDRERLSATVVLPTEIDVKIPVTAKRTRRRLALARV